MISYPFFKEQPIPSHIKYSNVHDKIQIQNKGIALRKSAVKKWKKKKTLYWTSRSLQLSPVITLAPLYRRRNHSNLNATMWILG